MNIFPCCEQTYLQFKTLIEESDGVIVIGHRNSDFDTVGAGYGVRELAGYLGRPAFVLMDSATTLAGALIERINNSDPTLPITDPTLIPPPVTENTLAVVVDTNRNALFEFPKLLEVCKNVVVIDHHQNLSDLDGREGMFIHEPDFSSASEIVARLISYAGHTPSAILAEALWAGIMLDTRSLTRKVTAKTFYAVGSLCELGADPKVIADFFDCEPEHYRQRAGIVCSAKISNGMAVSVARIHDEQVRIIGPQAANELLTIAGVKASFVIYRYDGVSYISARSDGTPDISAIMEKLGGGGNRAMAAAQFPGMSTAKVKRMLNRVISSQIN